MIVFMYLFCSNTAGNVDSGYFNLLHTTTTWRKIRDIDLYR